MKRLILFLAAATTAFALTCPNGFIEIADSSLTDAVTGAPYVGSLTASLTYNSQTGTNTVMGDQQAIPITAGAIDSCFAPGRYAVRQRATASGLTITAAWIIPTSGGPYKLTDVPAGVVSASSTMVSAVSGINFLSVAPGDSVLIAGASYRVATVTSASALTLTSAAGVQSGVSFSDGPVQQMIAPPPLSVLYGPTGARGPPGATGAAGAPGPTGTSGAAGTNGSNGAAGATGATGAMGTTGATGPAGAAGVAARVILTAGVPQTITHALNTSNPAVILAAVNSGCGNCYSLSGFAANTFVITSSLAADLTLDVFYAPAPPKSYTLTATPVTVFQSSTSTVTVTLTPLAGYTGVVTLSTSSLPSGVTAAFSPAAITTSGTSTLTFTASGAATVGSTTFTVGGTDGTLAEVSPSIALTVSTGALNCWPMNEGASPMLDACGHPNNLTNTNVTYTNVPGLLTNTATYNGSTSASVAANQTQTNFNGATPFSVCGWANLTTGGSESTIAGTLATGSNFTGWDVELGNGAGNNLGFFLISAYPGNANMVFYNFAPVIGTPFHFCVTTDGTKSTAGMLAYANGVSTASFYVFSGNLSGSIGNTVPVRIGTRNDGSSQMAGNVAGLRIFGYALSPAQVAAVYAGGVK